MTEKLSVLILPGLGNSGPEHWQSHWERRDPGFERVLQGDWERPRCADWVAELDRVMAGRSGPVVFAGHSSACALVAHWAGTASPENLAKAAGALLVAPSDPERPNYPVGPTGFGPVPLRPLPFPSVVVASDDDRYIDPKRAEAFAGAWGSRFVLLKEAGHINAASGFGPWEEGWALLETLRAVRVCD